MRINGEYSAIHCYAQFKHFQQFEYIYFSLTGKRPQPKMSEKCPDDFKHGLEIALQDEQQTVDFYLEIVDYMTIPFIKETFRRAAADEQNHAVWFLYYFLKKIMGGQNKNCLFFHGYF
ncbi:ferritin-like domain-containing protein [Anoxybacillus sp. LAT_33]|uniref:ferritin-like domain-containing protein n=1 Tax=Anoxybacillus TaxID=150247 RepID=UPI00351CCFDF